MKTPIFSPFPGNQRYSIKIKIVQEWTVVQTKKDKLSEVHKLCKMKNASPISDSSMLKIKTRYKICTKIYLS